MASETASVPRSIAPVLGLLIGVAIVLAAQFLLDSLADSNDLWHWIQHGLLALGGVVAGAAGLQLYRRGQATA